MSGWFVRSVRTAAVAAGTALAVTAPPAPPVVAEPTARRADRSVAELLTELQSLYRKAEDADETYNATEEALTDQRKKVRRFSAELVQARVRLADGRNDAGRLARQQYQDSAGSLSPYLRLLLSRHLQAALDEGHMIQRAAAVRTATVVRLAASERRLDQLAVRARAALDRQQTLAKTLMQQRDTVRRQLDEVERMLASLSPEELAAVERLEEGRSATAQQVLLGGAGTASTAFATNTAFAASTPGSSGVPSPAVLKAAKNVPKPSKAGARAIDYALAQLGKPYEWGAEGPDTFDCSGLTSQAWAHAGLPIPRTSQLQWKRLPRVPVRNLRPGDLVVYFKRATHVALYIGNGQVVQAPRPGTVVKISPIRANPLLGVVRPDSGAKPLARYSRPEPSFRPAAGDPTGFSSLTAPA